MRRYSYILVLLSTLLACVAVSCAPELDEAYVPDNMETVEVDVLFRVDDMVTKAMTAVEEDTSLKDVWVFQFDGSADASRIVGKPRYYAIEDGASRIGFSKVDDCTVVFLANTHDAYLELSDVKTFGDIRKKMIRISDGADCYDPDMYDLVSSAVLNGMDFTDPNVNVQPALSRIFARISFTLTDSCEDIDIRSVQLCNVPEKVEYLPHLLSSSELYPTSSQSSRINYPSEPFTGSSQTYFWYVCATALIAFLIQSVTYIVHFDRAYKKSLHELETYYDEDEGHKIKWVRFCYIISMLTILFVLVYLCLYWFLDYKMEVASVYTIWWLLYMLYLTSNFISFIGSHKLVLDAFAHKALSAGDLIQKISENKKRKEKKDDDSAQVVISESEIRKLEAALKQWVDKKSFREYDKSREDIARELNTTKEILHHYFISIKKVDFKTWRTELRIEEAKRLLLKDKNVSTNIIAEASGFSDRSNFHRQFVKIVGCSPKQWRDSQGHPAGI